MNALTKEKAVTIIDRTALFFFGVMVFFLPISGAVIESSFGFIFLCAIVKSFLAGVKFKDIKCFFSNKINLSLLIFYICIGFSIIAAGPLWKKSFNAWFFKWGEGVLLFYFAQIFLKKRHIRILILVLLASSFLLSIDGIYQKFMGVDFLRGFAPTQGDSGFLGIRASFNHYNGFAGYLVMAFFIAIGWIMYLKKIWVRLIVALLSFLIIINLLLTYSRGAWISFLLVSLVFIWVISYKKKKILFGLFLIFFAIAVINISSVRERFLLIFQSGGDSDRFRVWKLAMSMVKDSPLLGKGLGLFMSFFRDYSPNILIQYAHNCYLQMLAETGFIGFLPFLWFLIELMRTACKRIQGKNDFLLMGLFAAVSAFLVHMFFDTHLYSLKSAILFWLISAFLAVYLVPDCKRA